MMGECGLSALNFAQPLEGSRSLLIGEPPGQSKTSIERNPRIGLARWVAEHSRGAQASSLAAHRAPPLEERGQERAVACQATKRQSSS